VAVGDAAEDGGDAVVAVGTGDVFGDGNAVAGTCDSSTGVTTQVSTSCAVPEHGAIPLVVDP